MIDTHTHIYLPEDFADDASGAVERALASGVEMMVLPNVDSSTVAPMMELHGRHPEVTAVAMGLHPTEVGQDVDESLAFVYDMFDANHGLFKAVGEIGIDLHWSAERERQQADAFDRQLSLAASLDLPVIVHSRDALDLTLEIMEGHRSVRAVMHSFGGTEADVDAVRRRIGDHIYFGINGIVTFKNSGLTRALPAITADRVLLETDSPYLAPAPHRGTRNESSRLPLIAAATASALGLTVERLDAVTTASARSFFAL